VKDLLDSQQTIRSDLKATRKTLEAHLRYRMDALAQEVRVLTEASGKEIVHVPTEEAEEQVLYTSSSRDGPASKGKKSILASRVGGPERHGPESMVTMDPFGDMAPSDSCNSAVDDPARSAAAPVTSTYPYPRAAEVPATADDFLNKLQENIASQFADARFGLAAMVERLVEERMMDLKAAGGLGKVQASAGLSMNEESKLKARVKSLEKENRLLQQRLKEAQVLANTADFSPPSSNPAGTVSNLQAADHVKTYSPNKEEDHGGDAAAGGGSLPRSPRDVPVPDASLDTSEFSGRRGSNKVAGQSGVTESADDALEFFLAPVVSGLPHLRPQTAPTNRVPPTAASNSALRNQGLQYFAQPPSEPVAMAPNGVSTPLPSSARPSSID